MLVLINLNFIFDADDVVILWYSKIIHYWVIGENMFTTGKNDKILTRDCIPSVYYIYYSCDSVLCH